LNGGDGKIGVVKMEVAGNAFQIVGRG
jgi:hypothetical protein